MPPLPKRKLSRRRSANRANHWWLKPEHAYVRCDSCGAPTLPHHVCPQCGKYRGDTIVEIKEE